MSNKRESGSTSSGGVGCGTVLLIVFVTLKLTGNIDWSWVWVLSPAWIGALFVVAFLGVLAMVDTR